MATARTGDELVVRTARIDELALLPALETAADRLFDDMGRGTLPPAGEVDDLVGARCVLVAGTPPSGFARLEIVDDHAHLEQLSVHPAHGRQGIGAALLLAACRWAADEGHSTITLCTFADVPWNAPFYARHGFAAIPDTGLTPGLRALREREHELGLDALGLADGYGQSPVVAHVEGRRSRGMSPATPHLPTTFVHEFKDTSLFGTAGSARALAFGADSLLLALGGSRPTVDLWDTYEARQVAALSGHKPSKLQGTVFCLAFSPDGRLLASGGTDKTVRLWRSADGVCVNVLDGFSGGVERIAFSPAAPVLAAADRDSARLVDLDSGTVVPVRLPEGGVNGFAFSPDGSLLAVALGGRERKGRHPIVLVNPVDGSVARTVGEGDFLARALAFSPDGRLLAIAPRDGARRVELRDTASWQVVRTLRAGLVYELAFSSQGVLGAALGAEVRLWDPSADAKPVAAKVPYRRYAVVETLAFSPDGRSLATCRKGLSVRIYR